MLTAGLEDSVGSSSHLPELGPGSLLTLLCLPWGHRSLHRLCLLAKVTGQETLLCREVRISNIW